MKNRLSVYVAFALFAFTVYVVVNLFRTSVKEHDRYAAMANDNQFTSTTVEAARGTIYDSNGVTLAQSATVYNIIIAPAAITKLDNEDMDADEKERQIKACARIISEETGCEESKILLAFENKETRGKQWFKCASRVDKQVLTNIITRADEEKLAGNLIFSEEDTKRVYPNNDLAASVIGFTNYDGDGVYGIEAYYNDYLAGVDGKIISATDAQGNQMPYKNDKNFAAQNGNSLYLTIDSTLQYYMERELQKCVEENNVDNRACGIILNAKTGAVLAMATYPGFDLNDRNSIYSPKDRSALAKFAEEYGDGEEYEEEYAKYREQQWKNKAITEIYEPGSVFKVVTGSGALEEKVVDLTSTFSCGGGIVVVEGEKPINCWTTGDHGIQDFTTAMTNSCNPAFIQIGQRLGINKFCDYVRGYGFYETTGIDLPGEAAGIVYQREDMGKMELASCSFGQSNTITPIQMITAYAAVINGGYLLKPYVVEKIVDPNGNVVKTNERMVRRQVISDETSAQMRQVLETVVNNKGGSNAYIKGYRIGGKSGTSEKLSKNNAAGDSLYYVSSYVGFAPADDPEVIMLVMVDEPQGRDHNGSHVYYGSMVAAPVVSAVLKDALPYLGYYPEYTDEELQALDVNIPNVEGQDIDVATETIESLELQPYVVGSGGQVVKQVPSSTSSIPREGKVILYTEENYTPETAVVPDVLGYSLSDVNYLLTSANINFKAGDGATDRAGAVAASQNYEPGSVVEVGTVVEVTFMVRDEG
ncbi:MAG: penicillin-binding transpeptidase domain-containing protein [Ruminococcus sp.]|nr:penicillin-binding transpeptidase domain-containing protein [Ruminococcus sp.]